MKKFQFILFCNLAFLILFYNQSVGLNLALFGLFNLGLLFYFYKNQFNEISNKIMCFLSVISCIAFAWYGDFVSFLALFFSLVILQFRIQNREFKIIQLIPIIIINLFATFVRVFQINHWLPELKINSDLSKKLIAYLLIPIVFLSLFLIIYSFGSNHFSSLFTDYQFDVNPAEFIFISILGLFISFNFWNFWIPDYFLNLNNKISNEFSNEKRINSGKTFSFLDVDFERKSGEITFILLNLLLLVFILTYNYEQFFEIIDSSNLSAATHDRVNSVILSIIMAVGVILFYFKGNFNFDEKAKSLKKLAKIWVFLNGILIVSTIIKNAEYVNFFGLTYKRLGVFVFLLLSLIGLVYTYLKIVFQKSNFYLFNNMIWYFYGTLLVASFINWGELITVYNIKVNKGIEPIFLVHLNFNDESRNDFFKLKNIDGQYYEISKENEIAAENQKQFLSKILYYQFLDLKK